MSEKSEPASVTINEGRTQGASWTSVAAIVISLMTCLGTAGSQIYERATKDAQAAEVGRRLLNIETEGTPATQIQGQRLSALEGQVNAMKLAADLMAQKMASQGERLAEMNGKLDTLLERTKAQRQAP